MPAEPTFSVWRKIAMATWSPRRDSAILANVDIDAANLLTYLGAVREATGEHVTPTHLVGRAAARVLEALPSLNGRIVLGRFVPSPTIDVFFVVSLRTDEVAGADASATDLSGSVVRSVDRKPPWVVSRELAERAARIRHDEDPQFRQTKFLARVVPAPLLRPIMDTIGFVTEDLQLPVPGLGLEARPFGSFLVTNVGTYGLDRAFAPLPTMCHTPGGAMVGAVADQAVVRDGEVVVRPILPVAVMLDHRYIDGYQAAIIARVFRSYLEDPAAFDPVPSEEPATLVAV